jgi:glutamine synthetase
MPPIASKHYIPAVVHYTTRLADSLCKVRSACPEVPVAVQTDLLRRTTALLDRAYTALDTLGKEVAHCNSMENVSELANYCHDHVVPAMDSLRGAVDQLELLTDKDLWPVPTYGDLMFEV